MSDTTDAHEPQTGAPLDADFERLTAQVSLHLRLNHLDVATRLTEELLARWPDSTTVQELAGDVAAAQGKVAQARTYYKEALRLEPANIDAERKYGLALVTQTPDEARTVLIEQVITDSTAHRASSRKPLNAVLNALLFPGLGQLYNREHEKGLAMLGGGAVLLMLLFYLLVQVPYSSLVQDTAKRGLNLNEQLEGTRQMLGSMGPGYWLLVVLAGLAYVGLYVWGIYDAWRQGQSESERTLGI